MSYKQNICKLLPVLQKKQQFWKCLEANVSQAKGPRRKIKITLLGFCIPWHSSLTGILFPFDRSQDGETKTSGISPWCWTIFRRAAVLGPRQLKICADMWAIDNHVAATLPDIDLLKPETCPVGIAETEMLPLLNKRSCTALESVFVKL